MAGYQFVSDSDRQLLTQMLDWYRRTAGSDLPLPPVGLPDAIGDAPDIILAEAPSGGIPAMTVASSVMTPGSATCKLYRMWEPTKGGGMKIEAMLDSASANITRTVWNWAPEIMGTDVTAGQPNLVVARLRSGPWTLISDYCPSA